MNPWGGRTKHWTRDGIILAIQQWTEENGNAPTPRDWMKVVPGFPSANTVWREFGKFNTARVEAGVSFVRRNGEDKSRDDIVAAIYRWKFENGELPKTSDWPFPRDGWPGMRTVLRLFGTWNGAIIAAGYEPRRRAGSNHSYRARAAAITKRAA